jgi:MinD superfamily P-loop ATPase
MDEHIISKVEINEQECTGCGLCAETCPRKAINISTVLNRFGVHPAQQTSVVCSACGTCYYFCPEPGAIVLQWRDSENREGARKMPLSAEDTRKIAHAR